MSKELTPFQALEDLVNLALLNGQDGIIRDYYNVIVKALKDYEKQDNIINIIKETIEFGIQEPEMKVKENGEISFISGIGMRLRKQLDEKERKLFREWILKECFPKELKALEIIKNRFMWVNGENIYVGVKEAEIETELEVYDFKDIDFFKDFYILKEVLSWHNS